MLLFGVAIFSYIMGNFIEIVNKSYNIDADLDEGDNLNKFFGLLEKFNQGPINQELMTSMQKFFDFKWKMNRNIAFLIKEDLDIYS